MSNKNTFQGLQFRILETLEKQPKQMPLTAMEIADRLHDTEYKTEMKENVVFKVTRAVHAMKEGGKIIVADARGEGGRLCYQLPTRLKFPPKSDTPPTNPVLKPEIAEKIKTVEPKSEPKNPAKPVYLRGAVEKVFNLIDKSPYPLVAPDITAAIGPLYRAGGYKGDDRRLALMISGNIHHLTKVTKRVQKRRVKGRGPGIQFEYFTRRTGKNPHPSEVKQPEPMVERAAIEKAEQILQTPKPAPLPEPATPKTGDAFRPGAKKIEIVQLNVDVPREKRDAWKAAADRFGVTFVQLVTDAIDYALEHAE